MVRRRAGVLPVPIWLGHLFAGIMMRSHPSLSTPMDNQNELSRRTLKQLLVDLGALRLLLGGLAVLMVVFAPSASIETQRSGWGLVVTGVLPALGPMVFMVLLLDMLMSRVFMADADTAGKRRYRRAILFDGAMALFILLSWLPFLLALLAEA